MPAPPQVLDLVQRFAEKIDEVRAADYKETPLRIEFLDPFFAALGWDMANAHSNPREVIHEYPLKIDGKAKSPDYCFRSGAIEKFFVEAKKPSVNLKDDLKPAFQTRSYGWHKGLPFCVLTDFEEFAVYDCRFKPVSTESAQTARVFYCKYTDYEAQWQTIADWFGRDAVRAGSLEQQAASAPKRGAVPFDVDFLNLISGWRDKLADDIAARNRALQMSQADLNYAVQMTIDRILFLRMCEDRDLEPAHQLEKLRGKTNIYGELLDLFRQADNRYNSGLFHFDSQKGRGGYADKLTPQLRIDDGVLDAIIFKLYAPSPYNFRVMSVEILGQVYEQFLGKVIRLDAGKASIEEKPEVRKAGGVYYTPSYIVQYIVAQTLGKLCQGKTPAQVASLKVLDPACGSGSFLIGAYNYLLDWHLDFYCSAEPEKLAAKRHPVIFASPQSLEAGEVQWRLSTREKKRILLANIHGVDIDRQAVEVTKLSLLLKMLEDESDVALPTAQAKLLPSQERLLPDLEANIKCGNSLIGGDFYDDKANADLSDAERTRINAFSWNDEFPSIMKAGGFDAVIGNPPYSNYSSRDSMRAFYERNSLLVELDLLNRSMSYCSTRFPEYSIGCKDLYKWFTGQALRLLNQAGALGFIIPNTWFTQSKYADMKSQVFSLTGNMTFIDLGFGVFTVTVPTSVLTLQKGTKNIRRHADLKAEKDKASVLRAGLSLQELELDGRITAHPIALKYLTRWPDEFRLASLVTLREGQHIPRQGLNEKQDRANTPIIDSKNMGRYTFDWQPLYFYNDVQSSTKFARTEGRRIVIRKTGDRIVASLTPSKECYVLQSLYQTTEIAALVEPEYVLGLLNSRFLTFVYQSSEFGQKGRTMAQFRKGHLDRVPVPKLNFADKADKAQHDKMVQHVERMLELNRQLAKARTSADQIQIQRQIATTDKQIDRLVYDLYDLSEAEIALVEAAT